LLAWRADASRTTPPAEFLVVGGSVYILFYVLCCGGVGFAVMAAGFLYALGRREERARERARLTPRPLDPGPPRD
jgi:hypothetical protein